MIAAVSLRLLHVIFPSMLAADFFRSRGPPPEGPPQRAALCRKARYRAPRSLASTTAAQAQQSYREHLTICQSLSR